MQSEEHTKDERRGDNTEMLDSEWERQKYGGLPWTAGEMWDRD